MRSATPFDPKPPRPWLAALLSFLQTGLGHAYAGATRTGAVWWAGVQVVGFIALAVASRVSGPGPVLLVVLLIVAIPVVVGVDAWRVAQRAARPPIIDHGSRTVRTLAFLVVGVIAGYIVKKVAIRYIAEAYRIPSGAMEPTIVIGDWLYVVPVDPASVRPGALVVYNQDGTPLLKRAVAVPGDTIEMRAGRLVRDGREVAESYARNDSTPDYADSNFAWQTPFLADQSRRAGYHPTRDTWGPLVVPPRNLFVLGDNRHNSNDSRFAGFVALSDVVGRPTKVYFSRSADSSAMRWNRIGIPVR